MLERSRVDKSVLIEDFQQKTFNHELSYRI